MLTFFRRDTAATARERVERLTRQLATARQEVAAAASALGFSAAAEDESSPALARARRRASAARERVTELELAAATAQEAVADADQREADRRQSDRVRAVAETTRVRARTAAAFDAAVAELERSWAAYEAAALADDRARRAAGMPSPAAATLPTRLLQAMRHGAPALFRALRLRTLLTNAMAAPLAASVPGSPEAPPESSDATPTAESAA